MDPIECAILRGNCGYSRVNRRVWAHDFDRAATLFAAVTYRWRSVHGGIGVRPVLAGSDALFRSGGCGANLSGYEAHHRFDRPESVRILSGASGPGDLRRYL